MEITMPQFPLRIQISEKVKPKYMVVTPLGIINGEKLHTKHHIDPEMRQYFMQNRKEVQIHWLRPDVKIQVFDKKNKLLDTIDKDTMETDSAMPTSSWFEAQKNGTVNILLVYNGERLMTNPIQAGNPKFETITNQSLYSGNMFHATRMKVIQKLKEYMLPFVVNLPVIVTLPIRVNLHMYIPIEIVAGTKRWDLDNRAFLYHKCFMDLLATGKIGDIEYFEKKIPDDSIQFVTGCGGTIFYPVTTHEESKLVFNIKQDVRPEITNNPFFTTTKPIDNTLWG